MVSQGATRNAKGSHATLFSSILGIVEDRETFFVHRLAPSETETTSRDRLWLNWQLRRVDPGKHDSVDKANPMWHPCVISLSPTFMTSAIAQLVRGLHDAQDTRHAQCGFSHAKYRSLSSFVRSGLLLYSRIWPLWVPNTGVGSTFRRLRLLLK